MPFTDLGTEDNPGRAYFKSNKLAVQELAGITAPDKALSVPYVKIWQVKRDGSPVYADSNGNPKRSISFLTVEPPAFGTSVAQLDVFRERPPVSLESVKVKTEQGYGIQMWHHIELSFMVHRPFVVFDPGDGTYDTWAALLGTGNMFAMEYGWAGNVGNRILNGDGISDENNEVAGRKTIIFAIVNYSFRIGSDGQIGITIVGQENGENLIGLVSLTDLDDMNAVPEAPNKSVKVGINNRGRANKSDREKLSAIQQKIQKLTMQTYKKHGNSIMLKDLLDTLIAPLLELAFKKSGYAGTVDLKVGFFNKNCPPAKKNFGGNMAGKSIGSFQIPQTKVNEILSNILKTGIQMKVVEVLSQFLNVLNTGDSYESTMSDSTVDSLTQQAGGADKVDKISGLKEEKLQATGILPEIKVKISSTKKKGKMNAYFYIYDMKQEIIKFNDKQRLKPGASHADIQAACDAAGVPLITFRSGLSYIEEANFEVQQDDLTKTILMQQGLKGLESRFDTTQVSTAATRPTTLDPRQLIFSSAIDGSVTMIGNFVFDTFALVWLEFGVRIWDGPFNVMEKEDTITRGVFTSQFRFKSAGDDPLDTQGRKTLAEQSKMAQDQRLQADQQKNLNKKTRKQNPKSGSSPNH